MIHATPARLGILYMVAASVFTAGQFETADAETGDTRISVHYRTKGVRIRPTPHTGGVDVDFTIVLHADGTVADSYVVKDGEHNSRNIRLGAAPQSGPAWRVLDSGAITRSVDLGTHFHKMAIRTSGKNCKADVEFILKPGMKEYRAYSAQLKGMAFFSSIDVEYATCVIE
jgi:hypothetical protein